MKSQLEPGVYIVRVEVESDDITHQNAKRELGRELTDAILDGLQINGIREPVYGLDDQGNRVIIAYESVAWMPLATAAPSASRARRTRDQDDDDDFVLTANGDLELRL